jgi:hypothetical protein
MGDSFHRQLHSRDVFASFPGGDDPILEAWGKLKKLVEAIKTEIGPRTKNGDRFLIVDTRIIHKLTLT